MALAWAGLAAAMPTFWTVATQSDFLKGDVEDLSIDSDGRVFLGPSTSLVAETAAPFLWTVVAGADGTLWAGTGNEGRVLKIGKDGKVATFFDATELEVHAIVPAPEQRALCRHVARRQDLSGERRRHRREPSSIPTTSTSGRSRSIARATSLPRPATRA